MGMSEAEFFDTTPRHFNRLRIAWLNNRPALEAARFVSYHVLRAAGSHIRRFDQVVRFPWDIRQPRVALEPWDSPAMLRFSEEADRALAILNPEAYAAYMAGKEARANAAAVYPVGDDLTIEMEVDF